MPEGWREGPRADEGTTEADSSASATPTAQARAESELVERATAGDLHAFETLVRAHQDQVFRLCLRMLGNRSDAEDATQDTLFRAWRSLPRYRGEAAFSTWLYRIALNRCRDMGRARRPTAAFGDDLPDPDRDPEQCLLQVEGVAAIARAVACLSDDQRSAFVLREVDELSYQEIADVLGIGLGAVKSRLSRARAELACQIRAGGRRR